MNEISNITYLFIKTRYMRMYYSIFNLLFYLFKVGTTSLLSNEQKILLKEGKV